MAMGGPGGGKDGGDGDKNGGQGGGQDGGDGHNGNKWPSWNEEQMKAGVLAALAEMQKLNVKIDEEQKAQKQFRIETEHRLNMLKQHFQDIEALMDSHTKCLDRIQTMQHLVSGQIQWWGQGDGYGPGLQSNSMSVQAPQGPPGLQLVQHGGSSSSGGATNVNVGGGQPPPPPPPHQAGVDFTEWGPYCRCIIKNCLACKNHHSRDGRGRCQNSIGRYSYHKTEKLCKWCYEAAFPDE
jgi:hypothetical protein